MPSSQRVINAIGVHDKNGRPISWSPINPIVAQGISQFFQCAYTAGKDKKGISGFHESLFSRCHIRHFDKFGQSSVGLLFFYKNLRNNARHVSACSQGSIGKDPHKADCPTSINQVKAIFSKCFAKTSGQGGVGRIIPCPGTAVHNDVLISHFHISFG
jgi:hypothetical protein